LASINGATDVPDVIAHDHLDDLALGMRDLHKYGIVVSCFCLFPFVFAIPQVLGLAAPSLETGYRLRFPQGAVGPR